jgi:hypothetical protein
MRQALILIVLFLGFSCSNENKGPKNVIIRYDYKQGFKIDKLNLFENDEAFSSRIDTINKIIIDLTNVNEVFRSEEFIEIYEKPEKYIDNVLYYLNDTSNSLQKRQIAMLSMHRKGFDNNINFLFAMNYLYKQGLIASDDLFHFLFPIHLDNRDIIKFYKNKYVRTVLTDIRDNVQTPKDFRNIVNDILSGKTYNQQKEFLYGQYKIEI